MYEYLPSVKVQYNKAYLNNMNRNENIIAYRLPNHHRGQFSKFFRGSNFHMLRQSHTNFRMSGKCVINGQQITTISSKQTLLKASNTNPTSDL